MTATPEAAVATMTTPSSEAAWAAGPARAAESLGAHSVETMFSVHVTTLLDISLYVKTVMPEQPATAAPGPTGRRRARHPSSLQSGVPQG